MALGQLYEWYGRGAYTLERTTRDVALVPAPRPSMEAFAGWFDWPVDAVVHGPTAARHAAAPRARRGSARAAFETWRSLVHEQRLSEAQAIELMAGLVAAAARG